MNLLLFNKLREIVRAHEPAVWSNPKRCRDLLMAACPDHEWEVDILVAALEEGAPAEILACRGYFDLGPHADLLDRLRERLAPHGDPAGRALITWALALGKIIPRSKR